VAPQSQAFQKIRSWEIKVHARHETLCEQKTEEQVAAKGEEQVKENQKGRKEKKQCVLWTSVNTIARTQVRGEGGGR